MLATLGAVFPEIAARNGDAAYYPGSVWFQVRGRRRRKRSEGVFPKACSPSIAFKRKSINLSRRQSPRLILLPPLPLPPLSPDRHRRAPGRPPALLRLREPPARLPRPGPQRRHHRRRRAVPRRQRVARRLGARPPLFIIPPPPLSSSLRAFVVWRGAIDPPAGSVRFFRRPFFPV